MIKPNTRRFNLIRNEDVSGCSGTGIVAEGIEFSNGQVVLTWLTAFSSITIYNNIKEVEVIHGHDGKTKIEFIDSISKKFTPHEHECGSCGKIRTCFYLDCAFNYLADCDLNTGCKLQPKEPLTSKKHPHRCSCGFTIICINYPCKIPDDILCNVCIGKRQPIKP